MEVISIDQIGDEVYKELGGKATRKQVVDTIAVMKNLYRDAYMSKDHLICLHTPVGSVRAFKGGSANRAIDPRFESVREDLIALSKKKNRVGESVTEKIKKIHGIK